ncbi:MAG: intradiol ring-cleavage dioxygenase [Candidatus Rokuibacteriota bacterium]
MGTDNDSRHSRREFLGASLAAPAAFVIVSATDAQGQARTLEPTPACGDDAHVTPRQTEGPFFKPQSPRRQSLLESGTAGTRIVVEGTVLTMGCQPVPRALLDFWHADDHGRYDNAGYHLRGHQFADDAGRYRLQTIVPGLYPGRTRHFHVKVQAPDGPVLTTQLYFPGEAANERDFIFSPKLTVATRDVPDGKLGRFDFVLRM